MFTYPHTRGGVGNPRKVTGGRCLVAGWHGGHVLLPGTPGSGWRRRLDRRSDAGAASSDACLPGVPGSGLELSLAYSCPPVRRWMLQGPCLLTLRPGVGWASIDSRLVPGSPVAGCDRSHLLLPCVPGPGGKRRQQLLEGPPRRWIPSTAHCITGKSGVG